MATRSWKSDHHETLWSMKKTTTKAFDTVEFMRELRKELSEKLLKMSKEEIVEYFRQRSLNNPLKPSA